MGREIKFRSWTDFGPGKLYKFGPVTLQKMIIDTKSNLSVKEMDELVTFDQFTGVHDKDGTEIYEGDILENSKYRSVVKFSAGSFYADVIGAVNQFPIAGEWQTSVVIGNVHENPKMLEVDK